MADAEVTRRLEERKAILKQMRKRDTENHYREVQEAKSKKIPLIWAPMTSHTAPRELIDAMGVRVVYPENYSTILCAKQMAQPFCEVSESKGLSPNLCAYGRCIMGMMYLNDGPQGALPVPDLVILDTTMCDAHAKMWEVPALHYNVPQYRLDGVFRFTPTAERQQVEWRVAELRRMVAFLEDRLKVRLDYDAFKQNMRRSVETYKLWDEIQRLRKNVPCPRTTREMGGDLFSLVVIAGSRESLEYFKLVAVDARERVQLGIGMLPTERFRLFYDNIPVWYRLQLFDYLQDKGAAFVFDSYTGLMWAGTFFDQVEIDPEKPFEALALMQLYHGICMSIPTFLKRHQRAIKEWKVDGAVLLVNRCCRAFSGGVFERERLYREVYGIPTVTIEAEMADPRTLNEAQVKERFDVFLSLLESRARRQ